MRLGVHYLLVPPCGRRLAGVSHTKDAPLLPFLFLNPGAAGAEHSPRETRRLRSREEALPRRGSDDDTGHRHAGKPGRVDGSSRGARGSMDCAGRHALRKSSARGVEA